MLILVGVTVTVALNGGLFDQARKAAKGMTMAQIQEKADMVKALLIADLQTNEEVVVVKQKYMNRLQQEFEGSEIKGNKVIVEDGKYGIIVKNGDLDIEITENPNYVDKSELVTLKATSSEIIEDGKVYGIELSLTLTANLTLEEYVAQETEKTKNMPHDEAVLNYLSDEWEQEINSIDEYLCVMLNEDANEDKKHDSLDEWLNYPDDILDSLPIDKDKLPEGTEINKNFLYHLVIGDSDFDTDVSEEQVIEILFQNYVCDFEQVYYDNTSYLQLNKSYNEGALTGAYINMNSGDTTKIILGKNGTYELAFWNGYEYTISETIYVDTIESDYLYVADSGYPTWAQDINGQPINYHGSEEVVKIPGYIGNVKVTVLRNTFLGNSTIREVKIPSTVTTIGENCFKNCTSLTSIAIPASVNSISGSAFYGCTNLKTIYVEEGSTLEIPTSEPWGAPNATVVIKKD